MYNMSSTNNNTPTNPTSNPNDAPSSYIRVGSMSDEGSSFNVSRRGSSLLYPMLREGSIIEHPNNGTPNNQINLPNSNLNYQADRNMGLPRNESISQFFTGFNSRSNSETVPTPNFTTSQQQQIPTPQQQQQQQPQYHQYPPHPPPTQQQQQQLQQQSLHLHQTLPHPMNPPAQPHMHHHSSSQGIIPPPPHNATPENFYSANDYNHRTYSTDGQYYDYPPPPPSTTQVGAQPQQQVIHPGPANVDPLANTRRPSDLLETFGPARQRANSYFNRPRQLSILPFNDSSNDFDSFLKRDSIKGLLNYNGDLLDHIPNFQDQDFQQQQQQYKQHSRNGSSNGYMNNGRFSSTNLFDPVAEQQRQQQLQQQHQQHQQQQHQQHPHPQPQELDREDKKKPKRQPKKKKNELNNYSFPKNEKDHQVIPSVQQQQQQQQRHDYQEGRLVPLQLVMQSDDGRPLLGATKVDQLMLVIEARNKGINKTIPRGEDGSILDDQHNNGVIPQPIDLVGGVEKHTLSRSKNYQCNYCSKKFTQSTHLEVHVRSHIGYKPYECSYCGKRFTQGGNLRTHLRLHTGERPFHCDVCDRKFSRKGNLQAHKLTHENLKPFECRLDNCNKSFTQLGNLKSHQNRFHLDTLNNLTKKLAELGGANEEDILFKIENLPYDEQNLLKYFTSTYKNLNRGIRGRGKKIQNGSDSQSPLDGEENG